MRPALPLSLALVLATGPLAHPAAHLAAESAVTVHDVRRAEHSRQDVPTLRTALGTTDATLQRLAVRALGRFEKPEHASLVTPMLRVADPAVRAEAVNALTQMHVPFDARALLVNERDSVVRSAIYESVGRFTPTVTDGDLLLAAALTGTARERDAIVRAGAARGLESFVRRTARTARASATVLGALREAARDTSQGAAGTEIREQALLALVAAGDRDTVAFAAALRDSSEQVRRVAVVGLRRYVDDPSYIVRVQGLRAGGTCAELRSAFADTSEHVMLVAIDLAGQRRCAEASMTSALTDAADRGRTWRVRAHALVALARTAPDAARARLAGAAAATRWQHRTYAASAAGVLGDSAVLRQLATDREPNVVIAAGAAGARLATARALATAHAGLTLAAASQLDSTAAGLSPHLTAVLAALTRFTQPDRSTLHDPRAALLSRLAVASRTPWRSPDSLRVARAARALLADRDPAIADSAARVLRVLTGTNVMPRTTRYVPAPLASAAFLRALDGAELEIRMAGGGTMRLALLLDDAPQAVAVVAALADAGHYDGLTWHRIEPNFVIQGGSPGADEYDPRSATFMRDEVGFARNARGTFGISTRGRDTGDGQLYANLIDNYRLDHDYTVFARITRGLDVMDRVQEGDIMQRVRVVRRPARAIDSSSSPVR